MGIPFMSSLVAELIVTSALLLWHLQCLSQGVGSPPSEIGRETELQSLVAARTANDEFIARGLRSAENARRMGIYFTADAVIAKLDAKLASALSNQGKRTVSESL
jgi:hypothetical protein